MEIKRVAPERTDIITHASGSSEARGRVATHSRRRDDDLVFGAIPKSILGLISIVVLFIIALIFGVRELEMSIPVYIIVLVICVVMGVLLSNAPGFVVMLICSLLLTVGAIVELLPAVALGTAILTGASLIIRGE